MLLHHLLPLTLDLGLAPQIILNSEIWCNISKQAKLIWEFLGVYSFELILIDFKWQSQSVVLEFLWRVINLSLQASAEMTQCLLDIKAKGGSTTFRKMHFNG